MPALDPAAGHPDREALDVVVAAGPLGHRRPAELAAPDDQGLVEHAALLEVLDQGGGAAVDLGGGPADVALEVAVVVPVAVIELDEPDAALGQAAGQQAVRGEGAVAPLGAVEVEDVLRLVRDVHQLGDARLHPEGRLVGADPGGDLGVVDDLAPRAG